MGWQDQAACLDEDPELFFPIGSSGPAALQIEEAKQVCGRCRVRGACLEWSLRDEGPEHGVAGGLDEDERRIRKRRRASDHHRRVTVG